MNSVFTLQHKWLQYRNVCSLLGTLNHQYEDFVDATTILPSPFLILSSGQHNSHHCQSGHNLQEWAPQIQNKDYERAGEQRRPDISVPDRRRSCQWDKRLHERKSFSRSLHLLPFLIFHHLFIVHVYSNFTYCAVRKTTVVGWYFILEIIGMKDVFVILRLLFYFISLIYWYCVTVHVRPFKEQLTSDSKSHKVIGTVMW